MNYKRQPGDEAFRFVSLKAPQEPNFEKFTIDDQVVTIPDDQIYLRVLEIRRTDGTTFIKGPKEKRDVVYTVSGNNRIFFYSEIPYTRLWIRHVDYPLPLYKVPSTLEVDPDTKRVAILFYGGAQEAMLVGDPYFNAAYELQRTT